MIQALKRCGYEVKEDESQFRPSAVDVYLSVP